MQSDALELPDDLRIPLHGLQADAGYLIGRVAADSSMAGLMLQSLETRLSQVAEAAYRLNGERADLLEAAKAALVQAEGCWREHYGEDPEAVECPTPQHIGLLRDAITKAEASSCDSPSGAAGSAAAPIAAPTPQPIASSVETLRYVAPALKVLRTMMRKAGLTLGAEKADEMLQEIAKELPHDWFRPDFIQHDCCRACGIVRRADDKNSPCLGPTAVGLREVKGSQ